MTSTNSNRVSTMELNAKFFNEIPFEGKSFKLENEYRLVRIGDTEIYEIRTKKHITFKIDKELLAKLFIHKATQSNTPSTPSIPSTSNTSNTPSYPEIYT